MLREVLPAIGAFIAASLLGASCREQHASTARDRAPSVASGPRPSSRTAAAPPAAASARSPAAVPPVTLGDSIDSVKLRDHVKLIAKPRTPGSAHWKRIQALCADEFRAAGLEVELQRYATGVNVIGIRASQDAAPRVVISAHYDHIARCDGADDNASGVAALFEIARVLGKTRFQRTFVAACWDEEERGLLGSRAYSDRAKARGESIVTAVSLDGVGFASAAPGSQRVPAGLDLAFPEQAALLKSRNYAADFIAVVGNPAARAAQEALARHASSTGLPLIALELSGLQSLLMRDAYRSDHASFWLNGYPGLLLTDTANFRNPGYHCGQRPDTSKTLDYAFLESVTRTTALAALELLEPAR